MDHRLVWQMFWIAGLAALLLAASEISRPPNWTTVHIYLYWTGRILIEAGLFIGALVLISATSLVSGHTHTRIVVAAAVSFIPFALSVTALDIVLGLPELELPIKAVGTGPSDELAVSPLSSSPAFGPLEAVGSHQVGAFLRELVYLFDNHFVLCALIAAPVLLAGQTAGRSTLATGMGIGSKSGGLDMAGSARPFLGASSGRSAETGVQVAAGANPPLFLQDLDPPFEQPLLRVEAQEHYVRLVGPDQTRMVLYRFADVVRQMPPSLGRQVHRSHWVAYAAARQLHTERGTLRIETVDGAAIPVSRRHAREVKEAFGPVANG